MPAAVLSPITIGPGWLVESDRLSRIDARISVRPFEHEAALAAAPGENSRSLPHVSSIAIEVSGRVGADATIASDEFNLQPAPAEPQSVPLSALAPGEGDAEPARRLTIGARLGSGGMGTVLCATQLALAREVAVKVAHRDADLAAFRAEALCTARLEHPAIIPVYDAGPNFLVMRRLRGRTLEACAAAGAPLAELADAMLRTCDALAYAHSRGVIHRDIKPDNIMVGGFGEITLMDWGLATAVAADADGQWLAPPLAENRWLHAGTPAYMAPETARGERHAIGPATDVFLVGATLWRLIAGATPYQAESALEALRLASTCTRPALLEVAPNAPPRLAALVESCMADEHTLRPGMEAVRQELRAWIAASSGERESVLCRAEAREKAEAARTCRQAEESYSLFGEALRLLDRAEALNPDDPNIVNDRKVVRQAFTMAAVGAGDTGLARLLRRSGTTRISDGRLPLPGDDSRVRQAQGSAQLVAALGEADQRLQTERQAAERSQRALRWWLFAAWACAAFSVTITLVALLSRF